MKIECILLSNKNYELAYRLRENLKTKNIELKLATNIMQMFEFVNQNTKAIVIEDVKENIGQYSKLFSNHIQYAIVFIEKEKIYDINAKLIFEEMESFISSSIFLGEPKGYSLTQIKPAVEEVFNDIAKLFNDIAKIEEKHKKLFLELYEGLKNGTLYQKEKDVVWKCTGCGYTQKGKKAPDVCPVCQAKQGVFALHLKNQI